MEFYDSNSKTNSKQWLPKKWGFSDIGEGPDHLSYCSYENPCIICDDKYSTPDPVFCHGILMGGVRHGVCEACLQARILKNGDLLQDHILCSNQSPCIICDDKYSTPDPVFCHGILMDRMRHGRCAACLRNRIDPEKIPISENKEFVDKEKLQFPNSYVEQIFED